MVIIGIDPDSSANGVAVYRDGALVELLSLNTFQLNTFIACCLAECDVVVHIEDVCGISAAFTARDKKKSLAVKLKMAQHIGMCKQAQIEVERICEAYEVDVVKHKVSKMWKDADSGKKQFELITGWKGQSNPDKRSAAYFGWLGVTSKRK